MKNIVNGVQPAPIVETDAPSEQKTKGYTRFFNRKNCWRCKYYYDNSGTVPKQE